MAADQEYRLCSLKAYQTDDKSAKVVINEDNTLIMPDHDVTVEAVFEPIPYSIGYDMDGGALKEGETNPESYTVESGEIILNNPVKSGYSFVGWTGTELTEPTLVVRIPAGSTGEREYTAVWKEAIEPPHGEETTSESNSPSDGSGEPPRGDASASGDEEAPISSDDESVRNENTPLDTSVLLIAGDYPPMGDAVSAGGEKEPTASVSPRTDKEVNPSTGIALSILPLAAVLSFVSAARRKKK